MNETSNCNRRTKIVNAKEIAIVLSIVIVAIISNELEFLLAYK